MLRKVLNDRDGSRDQDLPFAKVGPPMAEGTHHEAVAQVRRYERFVRPPLSQVAVRVASGAESLKDGVSLRPRPLAAA